MTLKLINKVDYLFALTKTFVFANAFLLVLIKLEDIYTKASQHPLNYCMNAKICRLKKVTFIIHIY